MTISNEILLTIVEQIEEKKEETEKVEEPLEQVEEEKKVEEEEVKEDQEEVEKGEEVVVKEAPKPRRQTRRGAAKKQETETVEEQQGRK